MRHDLPAALLSALLLLAGPVTAVASDVPVPHPPLPWPGDRIGVPAYASSHCFGPEVDPNRAPEIRRVGQWGDVQEYQLDYWVVDYDGQDRPCGVPPPPDYSGMIDVGPLPEGLHRFRVIGHYKGAEFADYTTGIISVRIHDRPGRDISGAWFDPAQDGRGVFVMRTDGLLVVYWATHTADGEPSWAVMSATGNFGHDFVGPAVTTHGAPPGSGPAELAMSIWGELRFRYVGCGRARLEWTAEDPAIGSGGKDLVQLMVPDGIERCDLAQLRVGQPARWLD
jgi:hypothetical protein